MVYWYRIVICKNCGVPIDQGDCRQTETSGDIVPLRMLDSFELSCPACGTLGTYTGEDLKSEPRDHQPDTQPS